MRSTTRFRALALVLGTLIASAVPARGDVIDDLRRCDHVWVDHLQWHRLTSTRMPTIDDDCGLVGKPAGQLALTINPSDLGYRTLDFRARLVGTVQPGGWVRWTVDPTSVPRTVGGIEILRAGGSVDTTVRAIGPYEDYCGDDTLRTYRVQLDLRPNGGTGAANGNRLEFEARSGVLSGTVTVEILGFSAQLATPARPSLTLSSVTLASASVRAVPGRATRVSGTVWVTAEPDGRTYDVTLTARGTPANADIRVEPASVRFTGTTRSQPFLLTAPAGYYGTIEVTGTGSDGTVRRATVRITDPNTIDPVLIVPEYRRIYKWEHLPDPPPDVLRSIDPARRIVPVTPGLKPAVLPSGKASIPVPQEPFQPKAGPPPSQPPGKLPAKAMPILPIKGQGQK
jgi:hypothetical protein